MTIWLALATTALEYAAAWMEANNVRLPLSLALDLDAATKTYDHYLRQISGAITDLYNGDMTERQFVDYFAEIIPVQLKKAWREGLEAAGLDPVEDWEQLDTDIVEARILSEFEFVDRLAAAILDGKQRETGLDQWIARGQLWANRYNDLVNDAKLHASDGKVKYKWVMGGTEEHCDTCLALNGVVAFVREWEQSRFKPQNPPNDFLDCGGWRCDCRLEETTERRTSKALDYLLTLAVGRKL